MLDVTRYVYYRTPFDFFAKSRAKSRTSRLNKDLYIEFFLNFHTQFKDMCLKR